MLRTVGEVSARISRKVIPNPFIFAIVLSIVVWLLGIALTDSGPAQMIEHWYGGFWDLLTFGMQMVVILLFGYVLASSPPAKSLIRRAAQLPRNAGEAILLVTVLAIVFGYLSWGLGLIIGAISAREVSSEARRRGIKVHYPLAAAAGFSGLIIFNAGFSASAPLLVATEGHFLEEQIGVVPVSGTILTPYNLVVFVLFLLVVPIVYRAMHPHADTVEEIPTQLMEGSVGGDGGGGAGPAGAASPEGSGGAATTATAATTESRETTFAERLENLAPLSWITVLAGGGYIVYHFATRGFDLNLNIVNFTLLMLGLLAYRTPIAYVEAVDEAIRACGQIVLQFPFYAGIMGMMGSSGLVVVFAEWMVAISNEFTFPLTTLISAGIVNLFVPSAGGQWAVQGPILVQAADMLGVDMGQTIMAFSYGDQLTNALQPMWMLPLLGVTALKAREIVGYTAVMMVAAFVIFAIGITLLPLLMS